MSEIAVLADQLRTAGLKVTGPRLAILEVVQQDRSHPSAEEVHQALRGTHPSLSLSTVYATLSAFIKAGLVRSLREVDGRLRVDGVPDQHDHAVCRECGTILDVDRRSFDAVADAPVLPGELKLLDVRIEYDVICATCSEQPGN